MILLVSTSDLVEVVTGSAFGVDVHVSYVDYNGSTVTPGRLNTQISTATTTTVVGSPGSGVNRNLKCLTIRNTDATHSNAITVEHYDGTTTVTIIKQTLAAGQALHYDEEAGWWVFDNLNSTIQIGEPNWKYIGVSIISTTGSGTFVTTLRTNNIRLRILGGGGQGGGCSAGSSNAAAGSGGGSGAYGEKFLAVSPGTGYSYTVGAGGSGAGTGANGNNGGNSSFTVGGTNPTCPGGTGGLNGAAGSGVVTAGGGVTSAPTNCDVSSYGSSGYPGIVYSTSIYASGDGSSSLYGSGARGLKTAQGTGTAATGFGSGGSGGATSTATARSGGAGSGGLIIVEEYT